MFNNRFIYGVRIRFSTLNFRTQHPGKANNERINKLHKKTQHTVYSGGIHFSANFRKDSAPKTLAGGWVGGVGARVSFRSRP